MVVKRERKEGNLPEDPEQRVSLIFYVALGRIAEANSDNICGRLATDIMIAGNINNRRVFTTEDAPEEENSIVTRSKDRLKGLFILHRNNFGVDLNTFTTIADSSPLINRMAIGLTPLLRQMAESRRISR